MKILFLGDIVGRSGRDAIQKHLPRIKEKHNPDCIIINGENAAHGFGISKGICEDLFKLGVDVITSGNHIWDQRETIAYIQSEKRLLRPINYPEGTPENGVYIHSLANGSKIMVINAMGRLFMDMLDDPFQKIETVLKFHKLGANQLKAIVVDFHAETTSEKMAFAHYLDGRVSFVVGTHTHIPTADAQIFEGGTAYQTDAGMCGDYKSVIGMEKTVPIQKFLKKVPTERMQPAKGEGTVCGTLVETSNETGLAVHIQPIRLGPNLIESI